MNKIDYNTLKKFCADGPFGDSEPFVVENNVCATDRFILIMADKNVCDDKMEINNPYPPGINVNIFSENLSEPYTISLNDITESISKVPTVDEYKRVEVKTEYEECEACGGTGIFYADADFRGNTYDLEFECPICSGTGEVPVSEDFIPLEYESKCFVTFDNVKTGRKIIDENKLISIGKGIYKASYVDKVREVMSILNCETAFVRFNNNSSEGGIITFEFGNVKIAICYANEPVLEETVNIPITKL